MQPVDFSFLYILSSGVQEILLFPKDKNAGKTNEKKYFKF